MRPLVVPRWRLRPGGLRWLGDGRGWQLRPEASGSREAGAGGGSGRRPPAHDREGRRSMVQPLAGSMRRGGGSGLEASGGRETGTGGSSGLVASGARPWG